MANDYFIIAQRQTQRPNIRVGKLTYNLSD